MTEFKAAPGTRIATSGGEVEFDADGTFSTADQTTALEVKAALAGNPALADAASPAEDDAAEDVAAGGSSAPRRRRTRRRSKP